MERVEDLEGRLNRESIDYKDTIAELKQEKIELNRSNEDVQQRLASALKELDSNDKNTSAQAAADTKLQISRIQQQFKEEKQTMEANYKRTITNLESEMNIKGGIF